MPILTKVCIGLCIASLASGVITTVLELSYAGRAKLVQRMKPYEPALAEITGEQGDAIGTPQMLIIDDPRAFLKVAEGAEEGPALVSEDYLKEHGIYPLQLKTVRFLAGLARYIALGVFVLSLATLFISKAWPTRRDSGS